jgi:hypothetical protein
MKRRLSMALVLLLGILLIVVVACEPHIPIKIENRTNTVITVYVREHEKGNVQPNQIVEIKDVPGIYSYYLIEAKNNKGDVIYSRNYSASELHDADWKVIILPLENGPESSNTTIPK